MKTWCDECQTFHDDDEMNAALRDSAEEYDRLLYSGNRQTRRAIMKNYRKLKQIFDQDPNKNQSPEQQKFCEMVLKSLVLDSVS